MNYVVASQPWHIEEGVDHKISTVFAAYKSNKCHLAVGVFLQQVEPSLIHLDLLILPIVGQPQHFAHLFSFS